MAPILLVKLAYCQLTGLGVQVDALHHVQATAMISPGKHNFHETWRTDSGYNNPLSPKTEYEFQLEHNAIAL